LPAAPTAGQESGSSEQSEGDKEGRPIAVSSRLEGVIAKTRLSARPRPSAAHRDGAS